MAKKLTIDLSREQMKMVCEIATALEPTTSGDEQIRWRAIARRAQEALDFDGERLKATGSDP